ncbi:hypothetical protein L249_7114 [Ophiocordyceps polyrhachis-furcata BCC 54312]|uniref:Uncharacterized protein n=1 Tax=Ophiocordyceps polyrhachis-furcata BCC 54312 TaxID=1330021 RepID=A0A367LKW0_9HYPO|nr:hypothetical protein L249_7114 [Ophiocordyceps polyrhachis-furcata BCC 54312]
MHDLGQRPILKLLMGIVIAARELGKMESNEVFCGAVEEEEGGEKLVEMEIIISNQSVDHVIEKKKTNHVIVVFTTIEVGRYDRYWYSASIAYSAPIDVTAALYSAPIAVTIAVTSRSGAITAIAPL